MGRIGLVTANVVRDRDEDLAPLLGSFRRLDTASTDAPSVDAEIVAWDDATVDWSSFDVVILRSTWDYIDRLDEFLAWIDHVDRHTVVWNPAAVVRWNIDKRYLLDLAAEGVPIVPTEFVAPGEPTPEPVVAAQATSEWVVKPTVGAGSKGASRCRRDDVETAVAVLHAGGRTAMVQPYAELIDAAGETALVHVGDGRDLQFSHAFGKAAILRPDGVEMDGEIAVEEIGERTATAAELDVAGAALASAAVQRFGQLAYARVDVVPTKDGPVLMELELIEPSLYFHASQGSADRAAARFARLGDR